MKSSLLLAFVALLALPACLDPIVGTQCARGYSPCGHICARAGTCAIQAGDASSEGALDGGEDAIETDADQDAMELDSAADSEPAADGNDVDAGADDALATDAGLTDDAEPTDALAPELDAEPADAEPDGPGNATDDAQGSSPDSDDDVLAVAIDDALAPDDAPTSDDAGVDPDVGIDDVPAMGDAANDVPTGDATLATDGATGDSRLLCVGCADAVEAGEAGETGDGGDAGEAGEVGDAVSDGADAVDGGAVDDAGADGGAISDAAETGADGPEPDAAPLVCASGWGVCDGQCVDLTTAQNCGACSNMCTSGYCKSDGSCLGCATDEVGCAGVCVNLASDPDNCSACGTPCGSGLCSNSQCETANTGRVIVIGHDYLVNRNRTAMNRILGNAVFLWPLSPVNVLVYKGAANATAIAGANAAITQVAAGRAVNFAELTDVDHLATSLSDLQANVFLIYGQEGATSDTALQQLGTKWATAMQNFANNGGTVIVLDGYYGSNNSGTIQIINTASLFSIQRDVSVNNLLCSVVARGDALASGLTPGYRCEVNSVKFTTTEPLSSVTSVVASGGGPVVIYKLSPF